MTKKFLFAAASIYLIGGFVWLVGGSWLLYRIEAGHPSINLKHLHDLKNLIFLIVSTVFIIVNLNNYYKRLLLKERLLNKQLTNSQEKLNQLLSTYQLVTKTTNDVIWDYDIVNDELKWLSGYNELFGYEDEITVKNSFWTMQRIHANDRTQIIDTFKKLLDEKQRKWTAEYRYQCKDGTYKHVADRGYLILNEAGEPVKMLGAMQDIDIRKKYGLQLEVQNSKLKEIAWLNSHEVRRPLCNLIGLLPLIKSNINNQETLLQMLQLLETSANELDETIIKINDQVS